MDPFSALNRSIKNNANPLSKLEYLTAMMMQTLLAGNTTNDEGIDWALTKAVLAADKIIKVCAAHES